jgi:uncharacterized membrane protein (UPF0127 family)
VFAIGREGVISDKVLQVINVSCNTLLASEALLCDRFYNRMRGLLGKKELLPGKGLIIKPCQQIHSFFMQFSFDALFVDNFNRVIHIEGNMLPGKISPLVRKTAMVIELPAGTAADTGTNIGNIIVLEPVLKPQNDYGGLC